jgi:SPP1 family predicted phage head-tail adaptor
MTKRLNPGDLRTQVQFQAPTVASQDSAGQNVTTWVTQFTAWCQVTALVGREIEVARQLNAEAKFKLRLHFPPVTVEREWRAVMGTRALNIIDAEDPTGERRELVVTAKEWVE